MIQSFIGERVQNRNGEIGTIVSFDGQYLTVDFPGHTAILLHNAFEQGFLHMENAAQQARIQAAITQAQQNYPSRQPSIADIEAEAQRLARAQIASQTTDFDLSSVPRADQALVQSIFLCCQQENDAIHAALDEQMEYPQYTSCVPSASVTYHFGVLSQYFDSYVFRVFSRTDIYTKFLVGGVNVLESNTFEHLRILQLHGKKYIFSQNAIAPGQQPPTEPAWHRERKISKNLPLQRVIITCDCASMNQDFANLHLPVGVNEFSHLLFLALTDSKAYILWKHQAFHYAYGIKQLAEHLRHFTHTQIDFACRHNVLHTLPFIHSYNIGDVDALKRLESLLQIDKKGNNLYMLLQQRYGQMVIDPLPFNHALIQFLQRVEVFDVSAFVEYLHKKLLGSSLSLEPFLRNEEFFAEDYWKEH